MSTTDALTEAHRLAQAQVALDAVGQLTAAFKTLLKPSNLDDYAAYLTAMSGVVDLSRVTSAQLAAAYYQAMRTLSGASGAFDPVLAGSLPLGQVETALLVTGPVRVKTLLGNGDTVATAMTRALIASAGAVTRLVADAGRDTVFTSATADRHAHGWRRVTDGNPCAFCSMLASRGAVYKSEASAGAFKRFHDHCLCAVEPVFTA